MQLSLLELKRAVDAAVAAQPDANTIPVRLVSDKNNRCSHEYGENPPVNTATDGTRAASAGLTYVGGTAFLVVS